MSFLDKLKKIIGIDVDLSGLKDFHPHIFSDNNIDQKLTINKSTKTVNINIASLNGEDLPKLIKSINEAVEKEDYLLLESKANKLLTDVTLVEGIPENIGIIEFFKSKISYTDLEILRASLYVKKVYERGEQVGELKEDIIIKYGERGKNIVNLCTAGYFTTLVKPLFEDLVNEPNFRPNWYQEVFDTIVDQSPFAIFVSVSKTKEQLLAEVENRININKRYGIHYLNIHGISEQNIEKIEFVLSKLRDEFTQTPDIESGKRFIIVTIYF